MSTLIHQALKVALLLALSAAALQTWRLHQAQLQAADQARQQAQQTAALERQYREQEQRYREQINHIDRQAQERLAAAHTARRHADAAGQRLQQQLADYTRQHSTAATAATAAGQCSSDPTPALDLLADLFRRADERAGELAAEADEARVRGRACEGTYDAVFNTVQTPALAQMAP